MLTERTIKPIRVGSLFTGIGGIDMAVERVGMEIAFQIEKDNYCQGILAQHWPDVPRWDDVCSFPPAGIDEWGDVSMIAGGFPCQPVSVAGSQKGSEDERWLWDEMCRCIDLFQPAWVLAENVPGLITAEDAELRRPGFLFRGILRDLSDLGYDHIEWHTIPAGGRSGKGVGAPHNRKRVWIIAHAPGKRRECDSGQRVQGIASQCSEGVSGRGGAGNVPDPGHVRRWGWTQPGRQEITPPADIRPIVSHPELARLQGYRELGVAHPGSGEGGRPTQPASGGGDVSDTSEPGLEGQHSESGSGEPDRQAGGSSLQRRDVPHSPGNGRDQVPDLEPGPTDRDGRQAGNPQGCHPGRQALQSGAAWWAAEPDLGGLVDGLPADLVAQLPGRDVLGSVPVPRIDRGIPKRIAKLKALGNAVVPAVVEFIAAQIVAEDIRCQQVMDNPRGV